MKKGKLYSVGVGPGDPELLTAKAIRVLSECDIVAVPQSDGGGQTALDIAAQYIKGKTVRSFAMPMTHDRAARDASHDAAADAICALIGEGKTVAFLTLGDPTVYSTAWYVHKRVAARDCEAELVPGVPSFCAAAARLGRALCENGEMLHIIPASHGREREGLDLPGSKVLMKAGRGVLRVRDELRESGQLEQAALVERCGMEGERVVYDLDELDEPSGYFFHHSGKGGTQMIYFVGAGSGAPDLITVRGAKLLGEADVIVYAGSLVNPALLDYAKEDCAIYDSAKMTLEEVIAVMAPAARAGKTVVRLHTGDPCVYGAHREQMDALDRLGLAYEVCPGVSSFCGAAAALKAEYTLPNVSQTVILTRMEGRTPVPEREQIEGLAAHGATMVIFLSAGQLEKLSARLIEGGYAPETPAAIVYKATWPDEKVVRTTVGELAAAGAREGITKTALITGGGFLGDSYDRSKLYDPAFTTGFREASR